MFSATLHPQKATELFPNRLNIRPQVRVVGVDTRTQAGQAAVLSMAPAVQRFFNAQLHNFSLSLVETQAARLQLTDGSRAAVQLSHGQMYITLWPVIPPEPDEETPVTTLPEYTPPYGLLVYTNYTFNGTEGPLHLIQAPRQSDAVRRFEVPPDPDKIRLREVTERYPLPIANVAGWDAWVAMGDYSDPRARFSWALAASAQRIYRGGRNIFAATTAQIGSIRAVFRFGGFVIVVSYVNQATGIQVRYTRDTRDFTLADLTLAFSVPFADGGNLVYPSPGGTRLVMEGGLYMREYALDVADGELLFAPVRYEQVNDDSWSTSDAEEPRETAFSVDIQLAPANDDVLSGAITASAGRTASITYSGGIAWDSWAPKKGETEAYHVFKNTILYEMAYTYRHEFFADETRIPEQVGWVEQAGSWESSSRVEVMMPGGTVEVTAVENVSNTWLMRHDWTAFWSQPDPEEDAWQLDEVTGQVTGNVALDHVSTTRVVQGVNVPGMVGAFEDQTRTSSYNLAFDNGAYSLTDNAAQGLTTALIAVRAPDGDLSDGSGSLKRIIPADSDPAAGYPMYALFGPQLAHPGNPNDAPEWVKDLRRQQSGVVVDAADVPGYWHSRKHLSVRGEEVFASLEEYPVGGTGPTPLIGRFLSIPSTNIDWTLLPTAGASSNAGHAAYNYVTSTSGVLQSDPPQGWVRGEHSGASCTLVHSASGPIRPRVAARDFFYAGPAEVNMRATTWGVTDGVIVVPWAPGLYAHIFSPPHPETSWITGFDAPLTTAFPDAGFTLSQDPIFVV